MSSSTHALNSKGEFPLYVNPYDCSCRTCRAYIGEDDPKSYPCLVGAGAGVDYRGPKPRPSVPLPPALSSDIDIPTNPPPPAVPLVRVNAFATASPGEGGAGGAGAGSIYTFEEKETSLTRQLRSYRLALMNQREDVYHMTPDSEDEANLQTNRWDMLTEKIRATDALLATFHE